MAQTYHLSEMRGMWSQLGVIGLAGFCLTIVTSGCGQPKHAPATTPITTSSEEAEPRARRPSRGEVACHLHSCAPPKYCNEAKGVCELLPCNASSDCPYGYTCDFSKNVCR